MDKRNTNSPPVYTFQRKKRMPRPYSEAFTKVELEDDNVKNTVDQYIKYTKLSLIILILMFIIMVSGMIYTFKKGLPVKLR